MNEAIAQEATRKDVKDIADSHGGKTSVSSDSGGVNEVTHDNRKSRGRFSKQGKGHERDKKRYVLPLWSHKSHTGQLPTQRRRVFRVSQNRKREISSYAKER